MSKVTQYDLNRPRLPLISNKDGKLFYISVVHEGVLTLTCLFHQCSIQTLPLLQSSNRYISLSPFIQIRTLQLLFVCRLKVKSDQVLPVPFTLTEEPAT